DVERPAAHLLENRYALPEGRLAPAADVVRGARLAAPHGENRRRDRVADEREVARLAAIAVDVEPGSRGQRLDHAGKRHVRALAGAVDREVPQGDVVEPEVASVSAQQVLAGQLGDPVRGDGR